jgi:2-polyprenyl-3-methyl-5-hydroxy-6-metoxy-1,4-benzoquinol methylase
MKRGRFSEEQIIGVLKEAEGGRGQRVVPAARDRADALPGEEAEAEARRGPEAAAGYFAYRDWDTMLHRHRDSAVVGGDAMNEFVPDRKKAAALTRQVGTDFGAALTVALAFVGDRLGIFKTMADGRPRAVRQLADDVGLNERYIREWAATMAASGYLDYDAANETFRLNPEQMAVLGRENNTFFMGGGFQYAVACYRQLPRLMEAFQHGGGVPFTDFGSDIVEGIERLFRAGYEEWVAQEWIPAAPDVHRRLTDGGEAAEVGCGAGQCLIPVAMAYPNSLFFGYDIDQLSLERAWAKAVQFGISNRVTFERIAAEDLPYVDRFDLVTAFNCIHDMGHRRAALAAIRRIVKPSRSFLWSEAPAGDRLEEKSHSAVTNDGRR